MVVDAWSARVSKCAAPQQWNAFLSAFQISSRVHLVVAMPRISQSRGSCDDHHVVVDAWSVRIAK
eukprot:2273694-Lingulodinium_polyedra.AAC.1